MFGHEIVGSGAAKKVNAHSVIVDFSTPGMGHKHFSMCPGFKA